MIKNNLINLSCNNIELDILYKLATVNKYLAELIHKSSPATRTLYKEYSALHAELESLFLETVRNVNKDNSSHLKNEEFSIQSTLSLIPPEIVQTTIMPKIISEQPQKIDTMKGRPLSEDETDKVRKYLFEGGQHPSVTISPNITVDTGGLSAKLKPVKGAGLTDLTTTELPSLTIKDLAGNPICSDATGKTIVVGDVGPLSTASNIKTVNFRGVQNIVETNQLEFPFDKVESTSQDKVELLKEAGILDESGKISKTYQDWGNKVTRTPSLEDITSKKKTQKKSKKVSKK